MGEISVKMSRDYPVVESKTLYDDLESRAKMYQKISPLDEPSLSSNKSENNVFLNILDPITAAEYLKYQRDRFYFTSILPMLAIYGSYFFTRGSIIWAYSNELGPLFTIGFYFCVLLFIFVGLFLFARTVQYVQKFQINIIISPLYIVLADRVMNFHCIFGFHVEDYICITSHASLALYFLGMVFTGDCPDNATSIFTRAQCNPEALAHSLPIEQVLVLYLAPMVNMIFYRGVKWNAVVLSWIISFASLIIGYVHVIDKQELWTIICFLMMLMSVYEIERSRQAEFYALKNAETEHLKLLESDSKKKELKINFETKRAMVRYISHELRSPLNVINVGLKVLTNDIRDSSKISNEIIESINDLRDASRSAVGVLDEFLQFESIEAGKFKVDCSWTECAKLLPKLLQQYRSLSRDKGVEFTIHKQINEYDMLYASIDKRKIEQVLRNLIANAVKFTPVGGSIDVSIRFESAKERGSTKIGVITNVFDRFNFDPLHQSLEKHRSNISQEISDVTSMVACWLYIDVCDSGVGISEKNEPALFTEFTQFDPNKLQGGGGTGLGLWISKEIISLHDGDIIYKSNRHIQLPGSTFSVVLPCFNARCNIMQSFNTKESVESDELESVNQTPSSIENNVKSLRILVVDDSSLNRKFLCKLILSASSNSKESRIQVHHDIFEADDGSSAIEYVKESMTQNRPFDIIFMDNTMVTIHGPEAAFAIRSQGFSGKIIGVTGNVLPEDIKHFCDNGADCVLKKPVSASSLTNILLSF